MGDGAPPPVRRKTPPRARGALLAVLAALVIPAAVFAVETVGGEIDFRADALSDGRVRISGEYRNRGTAVHYSPGLYIHLGSVVEIVDDTAELPGGTRRTFQAVFDVSGWTPGTYTAVVAAVFEERGGRQHRLQRLFPVDVHLSAPGGSERPVRAEAGAVRFHPKKFWRRADRQILLTLANTHSRPVTARVVPYLKDGYRSPRGGYDVTLAPEQRERLRMPIFSQTPVDSSYQLDIQYEADGRHFSHVLSGPILPARAPAYFLPYLLTAAVVLAAVFLFCLFQADRPPTDGR